ncbi:hypothetical protein BOTBODRAFT_41312 [Botryobasidium botryosum FD-172 SS1]|uniref:Uncharacterized protein n=1 Tax=Botryobasidium botryosum (strain FD-172 SS1) TaxID=930990 RepID=A0A067N7F3_BOTB1|nr:hypothetical protein BOTBODRAFT_41312 [Botryobasidium botryosum FD-172 SS1]
MSMQSSVGNSQVYETSGEKGTSDNAPTRLEAGQANAHNQLDSKDDRSLGNRVAQTKKSEKEEESKTVTDPLAPAQEHGNKPSRGAQVDAELQAEEEEHLKRTGKDKGAFGPNV